MTKLVVNAGLKQAFVVLAENSDGKFTGLDVITGQLVPNLNKEVYDLYATVRGQPFGSTFLTVHPAGLTVMVDPVLNLAEMSASVHLSVMVDGTSHQALMPLEQDHAQALLAKKAKETIRRAVVDVRLQFKLEKMGDEEVLRLYHAPSWVEELRA